MPGPNFTEGPCDDVISITVPDTPPRQDFEQACPLQKKLKIRRKKKRILDSENDVFDPEVVKIFIEPDIGTEQHENGIVVAGFRKETQNMCETN